MQRRDRLLLPFLFFIILSLIILILFYLPFMQGIRGGVERGVHPLQSMIIGLFTGKKEQNSEIAKLRQENAALTMKLAQMQEIQKENAALHDQFQTTDIQALRLLPTRIVGMEPFLPGSILPDYLTVDKGSGEGVKKGQAVVEKNVLLGVIMQVSEHLSRVQLISEKKISFIVKDTKTGAQGIARGQGSGEMVLTNVVLADKLGKTDPIVTAGSKTVNGVGLPEGLVIGTITSVYRTPSSLFQIAAVHLPFDPTLLTNVFIITQ